MNELETFGTYRLTSKRGKIASTWWGQRLEDLVEGFLGTTAARRGKSFARNQGADFAGTKSGAFIAQFGAEQSRIDWVDYDQNTLYRGLRDLPGWVERLSAGQLSELDNERLQFLPAEDSLFSYSCTCLAWPGPCEHVCASMMLMVQEVDERPRQLLELRGIDVNNLPLVQEPSESRPDSKGPNFNVPTTFSEPTQPAHSQLSESAEYQTPQSSPGRSVAVSNESKFHPDSFDASALEDSFGKEISNLFELF